MNNVLSDASLAFALLISVYFVLWNVSQMAMGAFAAVSSWRHRHRHTRRARRLPTGVAVPPMVSIIVPAYNEELTIVDSLRALLALDYTPRELVVVNDGSKDTTLELMRETFALVPAPMAFAEPLRSARIRGIYRSVSEPDLLVVRAEDRELIRDRRIFAVPALIVEILSPPNAEKPACRANARDTRYRSPAANARARWRAWK